MQNEENPDLITYGSYRGRKITAVRQYRNTAYPNCECVAHFDECDYDDFVGTGSTPQEALDDLLEKSEIHDDGRVAILVQELSDDCCNQAAIRWTRL